MLGDVALVTVAVIAMIGIMVISIIPFVPGPLMMWGVALAFGLIDGFENLHIVAFALITVLMILGSTTGFWMPVLGMRAQGGSCWGTMGTIIGALVGTFFIPIPIPFCGTLIGAVLGALAFEFIHIGDARKAMKAGQLAMTTYFLGLVAEFVMSFAIFAVFLLNVWLSR
ncbi:MAG: DUF456 domain-containing protein [Aggregatilineales bacterium]